MSSEHVYDQKGNIQPKPSQELAEPEKNPGHITKSEVDAKLDAGTITRMQQTVGNAAVQRYLVQRQDDGPAEVDDETAEAVRSSRGGGQSLDESLAAKAGDVMGHDFSDVNVHTDSQADTLSRQLGAKAFTLGNDVYFQSGAYNPESSEGQRLISHELTHVVQQGGSPPGLQGKMTVNDPNDQYESEADSVADMVMNSPDELAVQRQSMEEEEEMPLQTKADPSLQRQEEEEDVMEKADPALQLQEEDEEIPLQAKADPLLRRQEDEEIVE